MDLDGRYSFGFGVLYRSKVWKPVGSNGDVKRGLVASEDIATAPPGRVTAWTWLLDRIPRSARVAFPWLLDLRQGSVATRNGLGRSKMRWVDRAFDLSGLYARQRTAEAMADVLCSFDFEECHGRMLCAMRSCLVLRCQVWEGEDGEASPGIKHAVASDLTLGIWNSEDKGL